MPGETAQDVVGVFNSESRQIFSGARPMKVSFTPQAKVMEHPLESGATVSDHFVELPIEGQLQVILRPENYRDTYRIIRQTYESAELIVVQTKVRRFENMLINAMPHEEDATKYDTIAMIISVREAEFAQSVFGSVPLLVSDVQNPANADTVNSGQKQPKSAGADIIDRVSGFFGG